MNRFEIRTERLLLRHWTDEDLPAFAAMNADPDVMEFFPATLDKSDSNELARVIRDHLEEHGWGGWACTTLNDNRFIGFVGLHPNNDTPRGNTVEIAWRLSKDSWGRGYATEAAKAAMYFAFHQLQLESVVSFTTVQNMRSRGVMEKLGMQNTGENFDHPRVAADSPLLEHVLYLIAAKQFMGQGFPTPEILIDSLS